MATLCAAAGFALAALAWGEGRAPLLAILLPLLIAGCGSRLQAFLLGAGYGMGVLRYVGEFIGSWFGEPLVGAAALMVYSLVSGLVWMIGWSQSQSPLRKAVAVAVAWAVALLPPAALAVPGHPLIGWGFLLAGWGWAGVLASVVAPVAVVYALARWTSGSARIAAIASLALLLGLTGLVYESQPSRLMRGAHAMTTAWGALGGEDDALGRMQHMGRLSAVVPGDTAVAIIWPESTLGRYAPSMYPVLEIELLKAARRAGRTHLIGMEIPVRASRLQNSAVAFYPDGKTATAIARQPAPVSLWRPWTPEHSFVADWTAHNILSLGQGDRAAVIFCYEEYLPVLYLLNELQDAPTIYVAMADTWAARYPAADRIQQLHSQGAASLFGRPYLRSVNRPAGS